MQQLAPPLAKILCTRLCTVQLNAYTVHDVPAHITQLLEWGERTNRGLRCIQRRFNKLDRSGYEHQVFVKIEFIVSSFPINILSPLPLELNNHTKRGLIVKNEI